MSSVDRWYAPDKVYDAHCHFFGHSFFNRIAKQRGFNSPEELIRNWQFRGGKIELPPKDSKALAEMWAKEAEKNNVDKIVLLPEFNDLTDIRVATREYPDIFIPFLSIDPTKSEAREILEQGISEIGVKGIKLYPPLHYFHAYEDRVRPIYEIAQENDLLVTFHFGVSVGSTADMRFMNPSDLSPVALEFPKVKFALAHFGTGYFRELLFLMYHYKNIYAETSSSNVWMKYLPYELTLQDVFGKVIEVAGVDHIIFGTDSSFFPRGWRRAIFEWQLAVVNDLRLSQEEINAIFYKNLERILKL